MLCSPLCLCVVPGATVDVPRSTQHRTSPTPSDLHPIVATKRALARRSIAGTANAPRQAASLVAVNAYLRAETFLSVSVQPPMNANFSRQETPPSSRRIPLEVPSVSSNASAGVAPLAPTPLTVAPSQRGDTQSRRNRVLTG